MSQMRSIALCLLLSVVVCVASANMDGQDQEGFGYTKPYLFVSKVASGEYAILGSPFTVTVTILNAGLSPAFDLVIKDTLRQGKKEEKKVAVLGPRENVSFTYSVTPTELGDYPIGVAEVKYHTEKGNPSTAHTAHSNVIREGEAYFRMDAQDDEILRGVVTVVTSEVYYRLHTKYIWESAVYLSLGVLFSLVPFIMHRVKHSQEDSLIRQSKRAA